MLKYKDILAVEGTWINPLNNEIGCHTLVKYEKDLLLKGQNFILTFKYQLRESLRNDAFYKISYSHEKDRLTIPIPNAFKSIEHYLICIFHEYGHSTGHHKRLFRPSLYNYFTPKEHYLEEITAEFIAIKLIQKLGIEFDINNCYRYIKTYLKFDEIINETILITSEHFSDKAVKYLLTK